MYPAGLLKILVPSRSAAFPFGHLLTSWSFLSLLRSYVPIYTALLTSLRVASVSVCTTHNKLASQLPACHESHNLLLHPSHPFTPKASAMSLLFTRNNPISDSCYICPFHENFCLLVPPFSIAPLRSFLFFLPSSEHMAA